MRDAALGLWHRLDVEDGRVPTGALVNALWPAMRASERILQVGGLLESEEVESLREQVRALAARVRELEAKGAKR